MSKFKVYRIIEERVRNRKPRFYIQRHHWIGGWWTLTVYDGNTTYRRGFDTHREAREYVETYLMKPEVIHHEAYHIKK